MPTQARDRQADRRDDRRDATDGCGLRSQASAVSHQPLAISLTKSPTPRGVGSDSLITRTSFHAHAGMAPSARGSSSAPRGGTRSIALDEAQTEYSSTHANRSRALLLSVRTSVSASWTDTAGQRSYTALRGRAEKVTIRQVGTIPECHATDTPDFSRSPIKSSVRASVRGVTLASLAARTTAETRRNGEAETQGAGDGRPSGASTSGLSAPLGWSHFSRVKS